MSLPETKKTERWILDNWATVEPQDVGPFEPRGVSFEGDVVAVECTALAPPNPRRIELRAEVVEKLMIEMGAMEPEPDEAAAKASAKVSEKAAK